MQVVEETTMTVARIETVDPDIAKSDLDAILKRDGCVIVREAIDHVAVDRLLADLDPYLGRKSCGQGNFVGFHTKRLHSLFGKSKTVGDFIVHDKVMEIMDLTLGPWCDSYQLNSNSITAIGPDETPQPLHRDDLLYPLAHPSERNACCTTFWALTDFTEENGATRIIPGSHLWDDEREPRDEETIGAVMPKGSFCVFLGGTYHGGGRNTTADQWRIAMFAGYALGWLRQEQNWYLSVTADEVREMPERLARLLGFNLHKPFLGWVQDFQDPYDIIHGYEELSSGGTDLYADGAERPVQGGNVKVA
jgi:ectoine hydroxylase-related dioxygenase (phytanoyl-CoA dioxygenase family)